MSTIFSATFIVALLAAGVRIAIPLMLPAFGEIFAERSGVLNINLEGQMLTGALVSFVVGYYTHSLFISLLIGAAAGIIAAMIMTVCCVTWHANQVVVGITLNMLALGVTSFWYRVIYGVTTTPPKADVSTGVLAIPGLSKIPFIGQIFFQQDMLFYISIGVMIASILILKKTQFGLKIRAAGEYPKAAETVGVNVVKMRYLSMMICGALAGLGGSFLSLVSLNRFIDNITASRGFIALAIVIFGKWDPWRVFWASLLFGTTDALQLRLQAMGANVPYQLLTMLPYALTIILMILTAKRSHSPAALGTDYEREQSA